MLRMARQALWCVCWAAIAIEAGAAQVAFDVDRFALGPVAVEKLRIALDANAGTASVHIDRLDAGERAWRHLVLDCGQLHLDGQIAGCARGRFAVDGKTLGELSFRVDLAKSSGEAALSLVDGGSIRAHRQTSGQWQAELNAVSIKGLVAVDGAGQSRLSSWDGDGELSGQLDYRPAAQGERFAFTGRLHEGRFSSADALQAAEHVAAEVSATAARQEAGWRWDVRLDWQQGEAYVHPVYLTAGMMLSAQGYADTAHVRIERAVLEMPGVQSVAASGAFSLADGRVSRARLAVSRADMAIIGPAFLAPVLMPASADAWRFAGYVDVSAEIDDGNVVAFDVGLSDFGFSATQSALSFGPVDGVVPWRLNRPTEARLSFGGGRWEKLSLGAFPLNARLHGPVVDIEELAIPVLDGRVVLRDLALRRDVRGWVGSGGMVVEPISMRRLSEAVGLPSMSGTLSAALPGLHIRPGELALDGELDIAVFDGRLTVGNLLAIDPFSATSRLYASIEAKGVDLAKLTETFSFGSITGLVDAHVYGLELIHWRPVGFEASIRSSEGRYPRRISQRAVQNIGALGGAGALQVIQRGVLSFFDSFGYRRLGLSCRLLNGVCYMAGLPADRQAPEQPFVIVEGGGIPALNVIGYNRRVDWNELLDRLQGVIESNAAPIIE